MHEHCAAMAVNVPVQQFYLSDKGEEYWPLVPYSAISIWRTTYPVKECFWNAHLTNWIVVRAVVHSASASSMRRPSGFSPTSRARIAVTAVPPDREVDGQWSCSTPPATMRKHRAISLRRFSLEFRRKVNSTLVLEFEQRRCHTIIDQNFFNFFLGECILSKCS
jgi:hypothetical protein